MPSKFDGTVLFMKKTIFIGYGNPDRGDDGVAWHLLNQIIAFTGCCENDLFSSDIIPASENIHVWFNFQLLPEMAETIAEYEQAVFIDAHTGEIKEDINFSNIEPEFQNSPFTHHFTAPSCLAVAEQITGQYPKSWLLSVRGYQFGFSRDLSVQTLALAEKAFELLKVNFLQ